MSLHEMQALHVQLTAKLINYVYGQGYELTWGEAYRTAEQAQWDCQHGTGISASLHCDRLAVDLQLFKDGAYLTDPTAYKFAGDYWKTLDASCRWGGDFKDANGRPKPDADHFSITFGGRS